MTYATVNLSIPFKSLVYTIKTLDLSEKQQLFALLEAEIAVTEEALIEQNDLLRKESHEAREAYQAGDYVTLDQYIAQQDNGSD